MLHWFSPLTEEVILIKSNTKTSQTKINLLWPKTIDFSNSIMIWNFLKILPEFNQFKYPIYFLNMIISPVLKKIFRKKASWNMPYFFIFLQFYHWIVFITEVTSQSPIPSGKMCILHSHALTLGNKNSPDVVFPCFLKNKEKKRKNVTSQKNIIL